jgi:hypothetical protein
MLWRRKRDLPRGRILAIKFGLNPNSSSLGADVTFLLFGAGVLSLVTPVIAALVRLAPRQPRPAPPREEHCRAADGAET